MKEVWTILAFADRRRLLLPILVALDVLAALAESFGMGLLIPFTQVVFGESVLGNLRGPLLHLFTLFNELTGAKERPIVFTFYIVAFMALKTLLWTAYIAGSQWIREKVVHEARMAIIRGNLDCDFGRFAKHEVAETHRIVISDAWRVANAVTSFIQIFGRGSVALVFAAVLALLSWKLLVFSIVALGLTSLAITAFSRHTKKFAEQAWQANTNLSNRLLSVLMGMRTVRLYRQEDREFETLSRESQDTRHAYFAHGTLLAAVGPVLEAVYFPFFVVLILVAHWAGMPLTALMAFLIMVYRLVPHVKAVEDARVSLEGARVPIAKMIELLRSVPPAVRKDRQPVDRFREEIVFDHVAFGYDTEKGKMQAVRDVSFTIKRGATVALVGASGAGKSTLVNLLLGFYSPSEGEIRVDGRNLETVDLNAWRRLIGFAGQDSQLFPGTIAENIAYGRPDAGARDIERAARLANVMEFADRLPAGLNTPITREGLNFSGGQRQRIALARALLVNPELLLLDEATNSLDNVTEEAIHRMLAENPHRRTTIIVAHRMRTVRSADWIVALDGGRIVEQGPPLELLRNNAAFALLYKLETDMDGASRESPLSAPIPV